MCSSDLVGHQIFDSPDLVTPVSTSPVLRVESIPEPPPLGPPVEPPPAPVERQRRGTMYVRVLAAVGIGLTLLFVWQMMTKF